MQVLIPSSSGLVLERSSTTSLRQGGAVLIPSSSGLVLEPAARCGASASPRS